MKKNGEKISMLTAYDYTLAKIVDEGGVDVILVGPMPTASIPMLIRSLRADFGVMITASHNPSCDNGMKLFDQDGIKLKTEGQQIIENLIKSNNFIPKIIKTCGAQSKDEYHYLFTYGER